MDHVMIDLETLGTSNDAVILSLGAVMFNPDQRQITNKFYVDIDPASCQEFGLKIDASTVLWWFSKDRADARGALLDAPSRLDLATALEGFAMWFGQETRPVWGNGASFDNVILRTAYTKVGIQCPWEFWHDRCYRTVKNMFPNVVTVRSGTHHHALDDASYQATHLLTLIEGGLNVG